MFSSQSIDAESMLTISFIKQTVISLC